MPAANYLMILEQGATFAKRITRKIKATDEPVDMTGCTARMMIRRAHGGELLAELTTENGGIALGGEDGTIDLLLDAEDTDALISGRAVYDLEVETAGGNVRRLLEGLAIIKRSITHD